MRVEVNDGNGTIGLVHAPEQRESNGVVSAESDNSWESLAMLGNSWLFGIGCRLSHEDAVVALFDLVKSPLVVVSESHVRFALQQHSNSIAYEVTGISPQSITFAQSLNGFASRGTL